MRLGRILRLPLERVGVSSRAVKEPRISPQDIGVGVGMADRYRAPVSFDLESYPEERLDETYPTSLRGGLKMRPSEEFWRLGG